MKIDNYSFGTMTIDGKVLNADLIVFPDRILEPWKRKEGHVLAIDDLKEVIKFKPDILIVGTGASGILKIPDSTKKSLEKTNIKLIAEKTPEATLIFNEFTGKKFKVVGAFHLTC